MHALSGTRFTARAVLFDMDGTLIDSTPVVERIWRQWAEKHNLPPSIFRHGRRAIDIVTEAAPPGVDIHAEVDAIDIAELNDTDGITPIPGAAALIAALPKKSWALVTSARPELARARMAAGGLPWPEVAVTSADVAQGKPHPDCYLAALDRLGIAPAEAVVFEDAPAGLAAGRAAGCRVFALTTTTPVEELGDAPLLPDLSKVVLESVAPDGTLHLRID